MKTTYKTSKSVIFVSIFVVASQSYADVSGLSQNKTVDISIEETIKKVTEQFQKTLDSSNSVEKSYISKDSAGPESAFCNEFKEDEDTHKFIPSVFHTPMGKEGGRCALKDKNGKTLVKVDCDLKKNCLMQGVCILDHKDGRRIGYNFIKFRHIQNYDSLDRASEYPEKIQESIVKESVFAAFDNDRCPFGYGIWSEEHQTSICMDPFRSVAADTKYHKAGDVLFFPALRGLVLPDKSVHNGFMTVRSAGGRIKGPHRFDFYTGICTKNHSKKLLCEDEGPKVFSQLGFGSYLKRKDKSCFYTYRKINDDLKDFILTARNYPHLPETEVQKTIVETWGNFISLNNSTSDAFIVKPDEQIVGDVPVVN